jgi:hypothetical protein
VEIVHSARGVVRWPDREKGPWHVQFTWANCDGYARLVAMDIRGFGGADPLGIEASSIEVLTTSVLRALPLRELADTAFVLKDNLMGIVLPPDFAGQHVPGGKTGRLRLRHEDLEAVAVIYRSADDRPTKAVADGLGISASAAAKRVAQARAKGLLEPTTQGRVGGPIAKKKGEQ